MYFQRRRHDNKNKICGFQGEVVGAERKIVQNAVFVGAVTTINF